MKLNLKRFFPILLLFALSKCTSVDKNPVGLNYFKNLQNVMKKEYGVSFGENDNAVIFILHSDTVCSCNGKNIYLVNDIMKKQKAIKPIIILKNDLSHVIQNMIHGASNTSFYYDSTSLMERNGSVFRYDKIFVVKNGKYDNMFDMEDKNKLDIQKYFGL